MDNKKIELTEEEEKEREQIKRDILVHIGTTLSEDVFFLRKLNQITYGLISVQKHFYNNK